MADSFNARTSVGRKRSSNDSSDDPNDKKYKNREAARKCREKKVKQTEELKTKNNDLMKKNEELSMKKKDLEEKLKELIGVILQHKNSGCILPQNVEEIINSPELCLEFIPVGTQVKPKQQLHVENSSALSDNRVEGTQSTCTGLFNGEQISSSVLPKGRVRNPSSRSPSRSPPAAQVFPNGNPTVCHSPSPASLISTPNKIGNGTSNFNLQPTWHQFHQKKSNEDLSPGLSPAQTVPNIDNDWFSASNAYSKKRGFPDIEEAVQHAQRDPGVLEDDYDPPHLTYRQNVPNPNVSLVSTGFVPTLISSSPSTVSASNIIGNSSNQISQKALSHFHNSLKPASSSSMTVSMNDTAQLLSQAMHNFHESEISDDLKKQYEELANNQANKSVPEELEDDQSYATQTEQYSRVDNSSVEAQNQETTVAQPQISYDALLNLAKNEELITVQYQGKDYTCNYEQVKLLLKCISDDPSTAQLNVGFGNDQTDDYSGQSATQAVTVMSNDLLNSTNDTSHYLSQNQAFTPGVIQNQVFTPGAIQNQVFTTGASQNQVFTPETDLPPNYVPVINNENGIVLMTTQASVIETPVESDNLPTTVLSMIEEDSQQTHNQAVDENYTDSIDYAQNVSDLPSLCLTEDDTNIFEKKRRTT